jgi:hypothetical protein
MTKTYEFKLERFSRETTDTGYRVLEYRENDGHFSTTKPSRREGVEVVEGCKDLATTLRVEKMKIKLEIEE